jgi:mRNA interferase RelE/StbE
MKYEIEFKPRAVKDLQSISKTTQTKILAKIQAMENDLKGDVKKLTNFTPEYRLRVGNYRILFEIENESIVIYRIKPRDKAYQ